MATTSSPRRKALVVVLLAVGVFGVANLFQRLEEKRPTVAPVQAPTSAATNDFPSLLTLVSAARSDKELNDRLATLGDAEAAKGTLELYVHPLNALATKGSSAAQYLTARIMESRPAPDMTGVEGWYRLASEQGLALASIRYCTFLLKNRPNAAVPLLEKAVEAGYPEALRLYAEELASGVRIPLDRAKAHQLYLRLAESGDVNATYSAAVAYNEGHAGRRDANKALELFQRAAEKGHLQAKFKAASMLLYGSGVTQDLPAATRTFKEIVELNSTADTDLTAQARAIYGQALANGWGIRRDLLSALPFLFESADGNGQVAGLLGSAFLTGDKLPVDVGLAVRYLRHAVSSGVISYTNYLFTALTKVGSAEAEAEARCWLLEGVAKNDPFSLYELGFDYWDRRPLDAGPLMVRALEAKVEDADGFAGWSFLTGQGVPADVARGLELLQRSDKRGSKFGTLFLGRAARDGVGMAKNPIYALSLFKKVEGLGFPAAKAEVVRAYLNGEGTERDIPRAMRMVKELAAEQDPFGLTILGESKLFGINGENVAVAEGLPLLEKACESGLGCEVLALYYVRQQNIAKAEPLIAASLARGPVSQYLQSELLYHGTKKTPRDRKRAMQLLKEAADENFPDAQYRLATFLSSDKDRQKSAALMLAAARAGNVDAMIAVGRDHALRGIEAGDQSLLDTGVAWLNEARARGSKLAEQTFAYVSSEAMHARVRREVEEERRQEARRNAESASRERELVRQQVEQTSAATIGAGSGISDMYNFRPPKKK